MLSVAYPLHLPYLSPKRAGEWSVGEWSEQSLDLFTDGGLGGFYSEDRGNSVTSSHQVEKRDRCSGSHSTRESDRAAPSYILAWPACVTVGLASQVLGE